jgi:hypothetical protein
MDLRSILAPGGEREFGELTTQNRLEKDQDRQRAIDIKKSGGASVMAARALG